MHPQSHWHSPRRVLERRTQIVRYVKIAWQQYLIRQASVCTGVRVCVCVWQPYKLIDFASAQGERRQAVGEWQRVKPDVDAKDTSQLLPAHLKLRFVHSVMVCVCVCQWVSVRLCVRPNALLIWYMCQCAPFSCYFNIVCTSVWHAAPSGTVRLPHSVTHSRSSPPPLYLYLSHSLPYYMGYALPLSWFSAGPVSRIGDGNQCRT